MPKVSFTYSQHATVTVATHAEVPQLVIEQGDDAIKRWLYEHVFEWSVEEEVVDTDYGATCGPHTYDVSHIEED